MRDPAGGVGSGMGLGTRGSGCRRVLQPGTKGFGVQEGALGWSRGLRCGGKDEGSSWGAGSGVGLRMKGLGCMRGL